MPWCTKESDCRAKACGGCGLCKGHVQRQSCEPWCTKANCRADACAGCELCLQDVGERVACHSGEKNDGAFEDCASWCSQGHASEHCKLCSCRACTYCGHASSRIRETGQACTAASADDSSTMRCELFCRETHLDQHCDLCKCKACGFCPARFDTKLACPFHSASLSAAAATHGSPVGVDDSSTLKCEPFCAMAHATAHCKMCKCAACAFCFDDFDASSSSTGTRGRQPMLGLNATGQLLRIVSAFDKRFGARSAPAAPPPRSHLPNNGASTNKHSAPLIRNSAVANGGVGSSVHGPLTFGADSDEGSSDMATATNNARPAADAPASAQMLAALDVVKQVSRDAKPSELSTIDVSTSEGVIGDVSTLSSSAHGHGNAAEMAKAAADAAAARAAAAASLSSQPSRPLPEAQHAGNGHERSEKEDGTYRYLIWTFLSVAFVAAGLYALITYTNRIAAVAGGKPRRLPTSDEEADEEMMDVSVLLASQSFACEQCACSVENEKATKVQPIEVGKPRKAERKQVKAPAPKSKTTKPKGSKSVTSSVHVPPAPCEVDETYFETPAARALPPLPTELSPKIAFVPPRLPPPPSDVLTASLTADLLDEPSTSLGAAGMISSAFASAPWVDDERTTPAITESVGQHAHSGAAARRGRLQARGSMKQGEDLD